MSDIHEFILFSTLAVVACADAVGLLWVVGRMQTLNPKLMKALHLLVYGGLGGMIVTGLTMFSRDSEYLLSNPLFLIKMVFVATLVLNSFLIGAHLKIASERPFAELPKGERWRFIISGAVSGFCWVGAMLLGFSLE